MITVPIVLKWLDQLAAVYEQNKTYLTDLDSAIGDADHGINMARGFAAVKTALAAKPPQTVADACKTASMTLIKTVGGASGPLYGTLFMKMGPLLGKSEVTAAEFAKALTEGVDGIKKMGKSQAGEKTMLDAWLPALETMQHIAPNAADKEVFSKAAAAAEKGMKDTIPMLATKGRASYLGERSVGHQDPGATSTYLMLKSLAEVVE